MTTKDPAKLTDEPRGAVKSVWRTIRILEAFDGDEGLSVTELSKRLGFPKSSVFEILNTLVNESILKKDPLTNRYYLGIKLFELGNRARASLEIRRVATPLLRELNKELDETVHLTVLDNYQALYVECFESTKHLRTWSVIGFRASLHCTSVGKAMLAFLPESDIQEYIRVKGLEKYTQNTITDEKILLDELKKTVERGYAIDDREHEEGVRCVGAPIRNYKGNVFAAISVAAPIPRMNMNRVNKIAKLVVSKANKISQALGYRGY